MFEKYKDNGKILFESLIDDFLYTKAFINECLRHRTPGHFIGRFVLQDFKIDNYQIYKDVN